MTSALLGSGRSSAGRNSPSAKPQANGTAMPASRDRERGAADPAHQLADRSPCRSAAAASGCRAARRHRSCSSARHPSERSHAAPPATARRSTDGPSSNAGEQLAHDRGLADALHRFAHQAADQKQKRKFGDEERLRSEARTALSGKSRNCAARHCQQENKQEQNKKAWTQAWQASAVCPSRSPTRCHRLIRSRPQCLNPCPRQITR